MEDKSAGWGNCNGSSPGKLTSSQIDRQSNKQIGPRVHTAYERFGIGSVGGPLAKRNAWQVKSIKLCKSLAWQFLHKNTEMHVQRFIYTFKCIQSIWCMQHIYQIRFTQARHSIGKLSIWHAICIFMYRKSYSCFIVQHFLIYLRRKLFNV